MQKYTLNYNQINLLTLLYSIYIMLSITACSVAFLYINIANFLLISGATLYFPLTYFISDIIAETYGYKYAKRLIIVGLIMEIFYCHLLYITISLHINKDTLNTEYYNLYSNLPVFIWGAAVSNTLSSFANIMLLVRWKRKYNGRFFWIRSIISTLIAELVMIVVIFSISFMGKLPDLKAFFYMMASCYFVEVIYALIFSIIGFFIVFHIKEKMCLDRY